MESGGLSVMMDLIRQMLMLSVSNSAITELVDMGVREIRGKHSKKLQCHVVQNYLVHACMIESD